MSAASELREIQQVIDGLESEIRFRRLMMDNDSRYKSDLDRETKRLAQQQQKVDRLLSYRGLDAEEQLNAYHDRIVELRQRAIVIKYQAAIERLLRLQDQVNGLTSMDDDVTEDDDLDVEVTDDDDSE